MIIIKTIIIVALIIKNKNNNNIDSKNNNNNYYYYIYNNKYMKINKFQYYENYFCFLNKILKFFKLKIMPLILKYLKIF